MGNKINVIKRKKYLEGICDIFTGSLANIENTVNLLGTEGNTEFGNKSYRKILEIEILTLSSSLVDYLKLMTKDSGIQNLDYLTTLLKTAVTANAIPAEFLAMYNRIITTYVLACEKKSLVIPNDYTTWVSTYSLSGYALVKHIKEELLPILVKPKLMGIFR